MTFTPKIKAYSGLLAVLLVVLAILLGTGNDVDTNITRTPGQLFQELPEGKLSNLYNAKIINKTNKSFPVELKLEGIEGEIKAISKKDLTLKKEAINTETFFIIIDKENIKTRTTPIKVGVYRDGEKIQTIKTTFLGPFI